MLGQKFKYARQITVPETHSQAHLFVSYILAIAFVVWDVFFLKEPFFVLITILVAIIILPHPSTTGLSDTGSIYRPVTGGFALFISKKVSLSEVSDFSTEKTKDRFKVSLTIRKQYKVNLTFAHKDEQRVMEILNEKIVRVKSWK